MNKYWKIFIFAGLQFAASLACGQQIDIRSVHYVSAADKAQIVFDAAEIPAYKVFQLANPARLVIDISNARLSQSMSQPPVSHPYFVAVRSASRNKDDIRVVVELKKQVKARSYNTMPNKKGVNNLIVELAETGTQVAKAQTPAGDKAIKASASPAPKAAKQLASAEAKSKAKVHRHASERKPKAVVVAIDAGHGGKDQGAKGYSGALEKNVVFAIANKLKALVDKQPGMQAVLVRKGDYFVDLRNRMKIARAAKADLFISIHADAFPEPTVKGASVFTLSERGATSEAARWLANTENASDLVGGVSLGDKDDVLASVLLDLSQTATQEASENLAGKVLENFSSIGELHYRSVQRAGFLVLKSPDIPSILVETAYISNPSEEKKLLSAAYQNKMASAIFKGILGYFNQTSPSDTRIADANSKIRL
ncbi:MAG: N-acetylmuramoyl-L-alanine amidase [Methylobacter sp.]|nr:MAG: N-acetylmuramoyl-L-alanine amidase [Methylobacter sp.]